MLLPEKLVNRLKGTFPGITYHISRVANLNGAINVRIAEHLAYENKLLVSVFVNNKTVWEYTDYTSTENTTKYYTLPRAVTALVWGHQNAKLFTDLPNLPYTMTISPTVHGYWCEPVCSIDYFGYKLRLKYKDDLYPIAIGAYKDNFPHALIDALEEGVWGEVFTASRSYSEGYKV